MKFSRAHNLRDENLSCCKNTFGNSPQTSGCTLLGVRGEVTWFIIKPARARITRFSISTREDVKKRTKLKGLLIERNVMKCFIQKGWKNRWSNVNLKLVKC